jgi:peptide/nickel transport system permease protein
MTEFFIRRIIQGLVVIILVTVLIFLVIRLLPSDPILLYLSQNQITSISPEDLDKLRAEYGLNNPLAIQYFNWMRDLLHGDMGKSITFGESVSSLIAQRLPITLNLGLLSFIVAAVIGPTLGTICALKRGKWQDTVLTILSYLGITMPGFWLGILLIYFLALKFNLLPAIGYTSPFVDPIMNIKQLIMPVICLAVTPIANLTRQTRSSVLEIARQDYVRTAWSKGLPERVVIIRHIIKNAFIPVVTVMGLYVRFVFGGAVLIETIFNIPGIGRLIVNGVLDQDYAVIQASVLIIAIVVMFSNLLVDFSYGLLDPRIRYD